MPIPVIIDGDEIKRGALGVRTGPIVVDDSSMVR